MQTEKMPVENVILNRSVFPASQFFNCDDSVQIGGLSSKISELVAFKKNYDDRNPSFKLDEFESSWTELKSQRTEFNINDTKQWIEITGFLLEITGKEKYAQEMEETLYNSPKMFSETECKELEKLIIPWVFTKDVDFVHVNLFTNATIKYEHSLRGAVEITQETDYPESGRVQIKFKMTEKRLIELFIRIPDWAEGATVTEKGVKYVAPPGEYSFVSRKWGDGDFVEVYIPKDKMPGYLKLN